MKSKGFKIVIAVLVAVIIALGALLAFKTFAPGGGAATAELGENVPEGALEDTTVTQSPTGGYEVITPKNGEAA